MVRRTYAHTSHAIRFKRPGDLLRCRLGYPSIRVFMGGSQDGHGQRCGLHFVTTVAALRGESAPCCLIDTQCQKITRKTGDAHEPDNCATITNLRTIGLHQFTYFEMSSWDSVTIGRFLAFPTPERIFLAMVVDNHGLFTQVDIQKVDEKRGIYVFPLFETAERHGANFHWITGGHMLTDSSTKLPDLCADAIEAMMDVLLSTGRIRIAHDTESWKQFLQERSCHSKELAKSLAGTSSADMNDLLEIFLWRQTF